MKKISTITTIFTVSAFIIYTYIFAYSGLALDEMMSYEDYFNNNFIKLWILFFLLFASAIFTIINLIVTKKKVG